jgi:hypothetical protein
MPPQRRVEELRLARRWGRACHALPDAGLRSNAGASWTGRSRRGALRPHSQVRFLLHSRPVCQLDDRSPSFKSPGRGPAQGRTGCNADLHSAGACGRPGAHFAENPTFVVLREMHMARGQAVSPDVHHVRGQIVPEVIDDFECARLVESQEAILPELAFDLGGSGGSGVMLDLIYILLVGDDVDAEVGHDLKLRRLHFPIDIRADAGTHAQLIVSDDPLGMVAARSDDSAGRRGGWHAGHGSCGMQPAGVAPMTMA